MTDADRTSQTETDEDARRRLREEADEPETRQRETLPQDRIQIEQESDEVE